MHVCSLKRERCSLRNFLDKNGLLRRKVKTISGAEQEELDLILYMEFPNKYILMVYE